MEVATNRKVNKPRQMKSATNFHKKVWSKKGLNHIVEKSREEDLTPQSASADDDDTKTIKIGCESEESRLVEPVTS